MLNPGCSDHSQLLLDCGGHRSVAPTCFKFLNCVVEHPDFGASVSQGWSEPVDGVRMFRVWVKLKKVREQLLSY